MTAPEIFLPTGWYTYPTLTGEWKPSKLHYRRVGADVTLCGREHPRRARVSQWLSEFRDHAEDAGVCKVCAKASGRGAEFGGAA